MKKDYRYAPTDWTFIPTTEDLEKLNALREYHKLNPVSGITRAGQWFDACEKIDACAALAEFAEDDTQHQER